MEKILSKTILTLLLNKEQACQILLNLLRKNVKNHKLR